MLPLDVEYSAGGQGEDGRIHAIEIPLIRRNLSVWMGVPLAQHKDDLIFGELRIDERERGAVESQIPGGEPGKLPLVRHGNHISIEEVPPVAIAAKASLRRRRRVTRISLQPISNH